MLDTLKHNSLVITGERILHPDMLSARQPLIIQEQTVCDDSLLIQQVHFSTMEKMQREITALGIKKDVFSDFEATLTQVPKYCYPVKDSCSALLVHPVPRFSLEDILSLTEERFPAYYNYFPVDYYRQWITDIRKRYTRKRSEGLSFFGAMRLFRQLLYPQPPKIPLSARKQFAAKLLKTVLMHHLQGISHDCITAPTIFFRTIQQPIFLANYSGIPSTIVKDFFPADLSSLNDIVSTRGKHLRDTVCLALITGRILIGERIDHRRMFIDSPRPAGLLLREIWTGSGLNLKPEFHDIRNNMYAIRFITDRTIEFFRALLSEKRFENWRKLNRATGGIWRSIPIVGEIADILFPTRCAIALRLILDNNWFHTRDTLRRKEKIISGNPELSLLIATLQTPPGQVSTAYYQSVFTRLQGNNEEKRLTFDSIMEASQVNENHFLALARKLHLTIRFIPVLLLLILTTLVLSVFRTSVTTQKAESSEISATRSRDTTRINTTIDTVAHLTIKKTETDTNASLQPPEQPDSVMEQKKTVVTAQAPVQKVPVQKKKAAVHRKKNRRLKKKPSPAPSPVILLPEVNTQENIPVKMPAPPPLCRLVTESSPWNIYFVRGTCTSCNLADVVRIDPAREDTIRIGNSIDLSKKYFIARKKGDGYDDVITVRQCPESHCVKGDFYEAAGNNRFGGPAVVSPGDLVGFSYLPLRTYIVKHRKNRQRSGR